jgi:hypothetical protein
MSSYTLHTSFSQFNNVKGPNMSTYTHNSY